MIEMRFLSIFLFLVLLISFSVALPITTSDANSQWNDNNPVNFYCSTTASYFCNDFNYSLNGENWIDLSYLNSNGVFGLTTKSYSWGAKDVWSDGNYIYVAFDGTNGIYAYNYGDTPNLWNSGIAHKYDAGRYFGIWGDGTYIYVSAYTEGIYAYTFDGSSFTLRGHRDDGYYAYDVWGDGNYIYLSNYNGGLFAYDFNGDTFILKGSKKDNGNAYASWGDGTYIYLANANFGLYAYTFDGSTFTSKGTINESYNTFSSVWGDGTYVYGAGGHGGIYAYEFDGSTFNLRGHRDDGNYAYDVMGNGNYIYLANGYGGFISAYDFNGDTFGLYGNRFDSGSYEKLYVDSNYVLVASGGSNPAYVYDFNGIQYQTVSVPSDFNSEIQFYSTDKGGNVEDVQIVYHALNGVSDECVRTLNQDWVVTSALDCNSKTINLGTGKLILSTGAKLRLYDSNLTCNRLDINASGSQLWLGSQSWIKFG